jgi:hypothetical protein
MRHRSSGLRLAGLLSAGAAALLLQPASASSALAQTAAPDAVGAAHRGAGALPTPGPAPSILTPAQLGRIRSAFTTPATQATAANLPAHGVLKPPAPSTPRAHRGAPKAAAANPAASRLKPLAIPASNVRPSRLSPQFPTTIFPSVQADNSIGCGFGANEPSVAQSTVSTNLVVVAGQEYQDASGGCADSHAWAFASRDFGLTWQATLLPGLQDAASGDVAVTFDPVRQVFVFSFLEFTRDAVGNAIAPGRVGVETSADGVNWGQDTTLASSSSTDFIDKDMITVDQNPASPHFGRVVVTWTDFGPSGQNFFDAFSDNGGASWTGGADSINIANRCGNGTSPAFDANGDLMAAWWSCDTSPRQLKEELSTDGGASWVQPSDTVITNVNDIGEPDGACSLNAGGTAFRCNSFPSLAGDPNPADEGGTAFVVVWADEDTLAQGRGLISLNGGSTWGGPTGFAFFHVDFSDAGDKFFPAAAFAANGRLNIGYSNRNVSATAANTNGTSYNEWMTEASSLASLVADSFITFNIDAAASDPGTLAFIGDYSMTSSLDNSADTFPAFADQDGTGNNHINTIDVCYSGC